jgi:RNA polymerase sigma-70 factor (ECF subfamily)
MRRAGSPKMSGAAGGEYPAPNSVTTAMTHDEMFPQLVEAHYSTLYRFALSLAKSAADAADLTQQTFLCWAEKGHTLRDVTKAKTWLFTTLRREFLRVHRRGLRFTSIEVLSPEDRDPPGSSTDTPARMEADLARAALQDVDFVFREALTLFYLQELSCLEIAGMLSIPAGTVASRIHRGKRQLRALLEERSAAGEAIELSPLAGCP